MLTQSSISRSQRTNAITASEFAVCQRQEQYRQAAGGVTNRSQAIPASDLSVYYCCSVSTPMAKIKIRIFFDIGQDVFLSE
jgi:hypothetical protein